MKELDEIFSQDWLDATDENKEKILEKYQEVYVYKEKIIPNNFITLKIKKWFRDETL